MSTEALALSSAPVRRALNGPAMGARWSAVFHARDDLDEVALARRLQDAVDAVEAGNVALAAGLRRRAPQPHAGRRVDQLPRNLFRVIEAALEIGELSDGALDIGVGDLVKAWGLGAGSRSPNPSAIAALAGRAVFPSAADAPARPCIRRARAGSRRCRLDLSAIAKGFGVDELARVMTEFGVSSWLVGIDGELRAAGREARRPALGGRPRAAEPGRARPHGRHRTSRLRGRDLG